VNSISDRILRIALTVLFVACACFAAQDAYFLQLAKTEYSVFTTFLSITVLHLRIRHTLSEAGILALSTLVLIGVASRDGYFPPGISVTLTFLGIASLTILGIRTLWSSKSRRPVLSWGFIASLLLIGLGWVVPPALRWTAIANPKAFDLYLYSFDGSLHFQPSFFMGMLYLKWPHFHWVSILFYMGIPIVCTAVYGEYLVRNKKESFSVLGAFLLSGPIGIVFYNFFPALGPVYLFKSDFPLHSLSTNELRHLHLEPIALFGFPNAMPSLHMTWALLGLWYSRGATWWVRLVAIVFLVFTVLSTLGTGEHYLVDLVVAFPFALMVYGIFALSTPWLDPWRLRAILFGGAGTFLWLALLRFVSRFFWVSPLIPWTLIVLTISATVLLHGHLLISWAGEETLPNRSEVQLDSVKAFQTDVGAK
jgi:hypothetical protein